MGTSSCLPLQPFLPVTYPASTPSLLADHSNTWQPVVCSQCHFTLSVFLSSLKSICLHPERENGDILRADPLALDVAPSTGPLHNENEGPALGLELIDRIRVRLVPSQPQRVAKVDQICLFYRSKFTKGKGRDDELLPHEELGLVIVAPEVKMMSDLPPHQLRVRKLAYVWEPFRSQNDGGARISEKESKGLSRGRISVHYLPFPDPAPSPLGPPNLPSPPTSSHNSANLASRLNRPKRRSPLALPIEQQAVALAAIPESAVASTSQSKQEPDTDLRRKCALLLERLHKRGHSLCIQRDNGLSGASAPPSTTYQELYLKLMDRHRHLDSQKLSRDLPHRALRKYKSIDPHLMSVPEDIAEWGHHDIAVAAYLMLLWKDMYPARTFPAGIDNMDEHRDWDSWGRPEGGFVDLGCGNGLLVHVLVSEGYHGKGYDLHPRPIWPSYPTKTGQCLVELAINPVKWFPDTIDAWESGSWDGKTECLVKEGVFLIGNHADELTPWLPLLSLIPSTPVPYLSLPCCLHTLDSPFTDVDFKPPPHPQTPPRGFSADLKEKEGIYKSYLVWLGWVGLNCGWLWEVKQIRGELKGWGIIGARRWAAEREDKQCRLWALKELESLDRRGIFRVKGRDHDEHSRACIA